VAILGNFKEIVECGDMLPGFMNQPIIDSSAGYRAVY
jgi:hypothetical protein